MRFPTTGLCEAALILLFTPLFFSVHNASIQFDARTAKTPKEKHRICTWRAKEICRVVQKAQLSAKPAAMHLFCHMRVWAGLQACGLGWLLETAHHYWLLHGAHHYWLLPAWLSHKCKFREKLAFFPFSGVPLPSNRGISCGMTTPNSIF